MRLEQRADDEEEGAHPDGGDEQGHLATETVDHEEDEDRGGDDLDDTVDTCGKQRVGCSGETNLSGTSQLYFGCEADQTRTELKI